MQRFILIDETRRANACNYIAGLAPDSETVVEIKRLERNRTPKQNAALWACAYPPIMEATGLRGEKDKEELHEYFMGEYFGWKEYAILGKRKVKPVRTTTRNEEGKRDLVSTKIMADIYDFIQQRAADNGIYVPDPDPMYGVTR